MSIETPKVEESTPIATKPAEAHLSPAAAAEHATHVNLGTTEPEPTTATVHTNTATESTDPATGILAAPKQDVAVEATPATEGVLGYKAPGLLKQFRYVKHFFWFSEEPLTKDALDTYVKSTKTEGHHHAAWAQETGKGVLFFAKRVEDKSTPSGLILLSEATDVTKVGLTDFSFKAGHHTHKFEAASTAERDSWVVAIQKHVEESKDLKTDVTGRDSYKKNIEGYAAIPIVASSSTSPTKHDSPKKSLDANTATAAASEPVTKKGTSSVSSSDEEKKNKAAEKAAAKKDRSQSRKRNSVFGLFGKKDDEDVTKKAEKEHQKEVKKAEKAEHEHIKEEKKIEAEHKKEEAKATHDATKAKEAAEAAAIAAAPTAVVASVEKKEEKKVEKPVEEITTPTEKKNKRASVFGGFFGKNKITSPTSEKMESEATPSVPPKDESPVVSETAPKLDEPIDTKPLDTTAMIAPADNAESSAAPIAAPEKPKTTEAAPLADTTTTPRTEKKSFLAGVFKKQEKKEEPRTNEEVVKEGAPVPATESTIAEHTTETPVKDAEVAKEERPAREKRRTSLFGSLGTLKRKTEKSPEPVSSGANEETTPVGLKREKSPLPSKLGGLFRKPSRATKSETTAAADTDSSTKSETVTGAPATSDIPSTLIEPKANTTTVEPKGDSEIVGDVVPEKLHSTVHDAVTVPEAKTTA